MADTHIWVATIAGMCNAKIDPSSDFYTGPFTPNTRARICDLYVKNAGDVEGRIKIRVYEHPGEPTEHIIADLITDAPVSPGSTVLIPIDVNIPDKPGDWPLGVKVWCETEAEPSW